MGTTDRNHKAGCRKTNRPGDARGHVICIEQERRFIKQRPLPGGLGGQNDRLADSVPPVRAPHSSGGVLILHQTNARRQSGKRLPFRRGELARCQSEALEQGPSRRLRLLALRFAPGRGLGFRCSLRVSAWHLLPTVLWGNLGQGLARLRVPLRHRHA
eukprot:6463471-Amphidinium_carterae.1